MIEELGVGFSSPPYPFQHHGPVLVCGNAWCLMEDLLAARKIPRLEKAPIIGVNGTSYHLRLDFLFSQSHLDKFPRWKAAQRRLHSDFTCHTTGSGAAADKFPFIDYWWKDTAGQGTSTWAARKLARFLGFDEVVLCGMPLEQGGYYKGKEFAKHFYQQPKINFYRQGVEKDIDWHGGCSSMSGWTRELLGAPVDK